MKNKHEHIPDGWEVKKLGQICKTFSGGTPSIDNVEYYDGDIPFIRSGEIHSNQTKLFLTQAGLNNSSAKRVEVGDLLYALYGANSGDVDISKISGAINQAILCIRSTKVNILYLKILLEKAKQSILNKYLQGGQGNLSAQIIKSLQFPIPPLSEQGKIAEVLGCWDEGIEKIEKIISLKEQQKKGLMQKLLNPNRNLKMKRFDEIFTDFTKKNTDDGELLSATQEYGVIPRSMLKRHVMSPEGKIVGYKLVEKGNFVISLRSFQGGIEYSEFYGIISPAYTVLKNLLKIDDNFYKYFFKSYLFIEKYISKAIIGIRDGKQISYPDLRSVKIPYPTLEEQSAIANILSTADTEITLLKQKLALFKKQKNGLMQQLLTGKTRLKFS